MFSSRALACSLVLAFTLAGCGDPEAARQAAAAQAAARTEALANEALRQFVAVKSTGNHELAFAFAQDLLSRYPQSTAAKSVQAELPALKQRAETLAEQRRLESLWTYHEVEDKEYNGTVYTAYIHASRSDASRNPDVRLVLRRHPSWGQSVYLLIDGDDFVCQKECQMALSFNGSEQHSVLVSRAEGANPPALFLEEDAKALDLIDRAERIQLSIPLASGGTPEYLFEVGALDIAQLGPPIKAAP